MLKETRYQNIFRDVYYLMDRHYPPNDTEEYWDALWKDANDVHAKHGDEFTRGVIVEILKEFDRTLREGKHVKNDQIIQNTSGISGSAGREDGEV